MVPERREGRGKGQGERMGEGEGRGEGEGGGHCKIGLFRIRKTLAASKLYPTNAGVWLFPVLTFSPLMRRWPLARMAFGQRQGDPVSVYSPLSGVGHMATWL